MKYYRATIRYLLAGVLSSTLGTVYANPEGAAVAAGSVNISQPDAHTVEIQQTSNKAIINWQSFNINANEHTRFVQPSSSSIILNRINPANGASNILGKLSSNGQVWLVNPAGIFFGASAQIDVGGLLATTANIKDDDFLKGNYQFTQDPAWSNSVINEGHIKAADYGLVALVAPAVANRGIIQANLGKIALAASNEFVLDLYGDQLVNFSINSKVTKASVDNNGNVMQDGVNNTGELIADGGKILVSAQVAKDVVDNAINMDGYAQANTVVAQKGQIILLGGDEGVVKVTGKLVAAGKANKSRGGSVKVTGQKVGLFNQAKVDVSGDHGGGEILIGGDYQGKGDLANAAATFIDQNASLNADAISEGNGGKIIVWADDTARIYGHISTRGGAIGGNGGFVETSGKQFLDVNTVPDISAPNGLGGTWLLDPYNVTIVAGSGNSNINGANPFAPTGDDSQLGVNLILTALTSGNVVITTGAGGTQAGDITVDTDIDYNGKGSGRSLTLTAADDVILNGNIYDSNLASYDAMQVIINADSDNSGAGSLTVNTGKSIDTNGAALTITANDLILNGALTNSFGDTTINAKGSIGLGNATGAMQISGSELQNINTGYLYLNSGNDSNIIVDGVSAINSNNISGRVTLQAATGANSSVTFQNNASSFKALTVYANNGITANSSVATSASDFLFNGDFDGANLDQINGITVANGATLSSASTLTLNGIYGAFNLNGNVTAASALSITNTISDINIASTSLLTSGAATSLSSTMGNINLTGNTINAGASLTFSTTVGKTFINGSPILNAANSITFNHSVDLQGNTLTLNTNSDNNDNGRLTINTGASLGNASTGGNLNITTYDLILDGSINVGASSGNNVTITANGTAPILTLGNGAATFLLTGAELQKITANNLTLNAGNSSTSGTINVNGITAANVANIAGNLTLNATNGNTGSIAFLTSASTFKNLTANADNGISVDVNVTTTTNGLTLNADADNTTSGALTLNANLSSAGALSLSAASGGITLGSNVALSATNAAINLNHAINGNKNLTINAGSGATTFSGAVGDSTALGAGTGAAITLNSTGSTIFNSSVAANSGITAAGAVTFNGNVNLGNGDTASTFNGNTTLAGITFAAYDGATFGDAASDQINITTDATSISSTNSNLIFTGIVSSTPALTINSGSANITMNNASNSISSLALTGNNVSVQNSTALDFGTSTISGDLTVTNTGAITQSGHILVNGANKTATFAAGSANNITLNNVDNDFTKLIITSGNNVAVTDTNAIDLGASTVSGTFGITTINGAITDSGNLAITGAATFSANGNNITLDSSGNNFSSVGITSGNNVILADADAIDLAASTVSGTLNVTTTNGAITDSGNLAITGAATFSASDNNITLDSSGNNFSSVGISAANNVTLVDTNAIALAASTITGNLDVTAGSHITQTGALTVTGTPTFTVTNANSDILLASAANNFTINPVFTSNGNIRDIALRNVNASATAPTLPATLRNLTLTFDNAGLILSAATLSGSLNATANGAITQSGALSVAGSTTLTAGSNNITLNDNGNDFNNIAVISGNDVILTDANAIALAASTVSGNLNVTTINGAITDSGNLTVTGAATFSANGNHITLDNSDNNFSSIGISAANNVTLVDANAIDLAASTISGDLAVTTTNGAITQSGALSVNGAATFAAGSANNITLTNTTNDFASVIASSGNNISITDNNSINLGAMTAAGNIIITAGGSIADSGILTGTTLTTTSVGGTILDYGHAITNFNATNTSSGNIQLINTANTLTLTGISQAGSGDIIIANTGTLTNAGAVSTTGSGNLNLTAAGASSDININANMTTQGGAATLNAGRNLSVANNKTLTTNNGALAITANDMILNGGSSVDFANLHSGTADTIITANSSIDLGNANAGAMQISGSELQHITAGNLILNAGNNSNINVNNVTAANSNNINNSVYLNATAGTTGGITFQNNASAFKTLVANANNGIIIGANVATTAGALTLNGDADNTGSSSDAIDLGANLTAAGTLTLSADTGNINLTADSALIGANITINPTINGAHNLTLNAGSGGNILLSGDIGNNIALNNFIITNANNVLSSGIIRANNFTQSAGSGMTNADLNITHAISITTAAFNGDVFANAVSLGIDTGIVFGAIAGASGQTGADAIVLLNTIQANSVFFDNIDLYNNSNNNNNNNSNSNTNISPNIITLETEINPVIILPYPTIQSMFSSPDLTNTLLNNNSKHAQAKQINSSDKTFATEDAIQICSGVGFTTNCLPLRIEF